MKKLFCFLWQGTKIIGLNLKKGIKTHPIAFWPGVFFALFILIYTFIFHTSFSYMGNTDTSVLTMVFSQFKGVVIFFFLKILFSYFVIFVFLNLLFYFGLKKIEVFLHKKFSSLVLKINIIAFLFLTVLFQFFKSLIYYPGLYYDSFYQKRVIFKKITHTITQFFHPYVFFIIQYVFLGLFLALVLWYFYPLFMHKILKPVLRFFSLQLNLRHKKWLFLFLLPLVLLLSFSFFKSFSKKNHSYNILILAADSLRPDHFSGYGYSKPTTPHINTLIQQGLSFRNVYSCVPRTFPAWVSILTSQNPQNHGIRHMFPTNKTRNKNFHALPFVLKQKNYHTFVSGDFAADIFPRINLGFKNIDAPSLNFSLLIKQIMIQNQPFLMAFFTNNIGRKWFPCLKGHANWVEPSFITQSLKKQIKKAQSSNIPFFGLGFYSSTHFPFAVPYPYYKKFTKPNYQGPYKYLKTQVLNQMDSAVKEQDKEQIIALYDGGLKAFDDAVGEMLSFLKQEKLLDNTLIVILSDHGENLYDKEYGMGHGEHLRGSFSLKIPVIMAGPFLNHQQNFEIRSAIDIAPTLLEILNIPKPPSFLGQSLLHPNLNKVKSYQETGIWFDNTSTAFFQQLRILYPGIMGLSEVDFAINDEIVLKVQKENWVNMAKHRAMIIDHYKIIYIPLQDRVEFELYDLQKDPEENKNLASTHQALLKYYKEIFYQEILKDSGVIVKEGWILPVFDEPIF